MGDVSETFIILGGAGDLAERLLIPGIAEYSATSGVEFTIVGVGREEPDGGYAPFVEGAASGVDAAASGVDAKVARGLAARAEFVAADATDPADMRKLLSGREPGTVVYFALAPQVATKAIAAMKGADLPERMRFAMEKPFGNDAGAAADLNEQLWELLDEEQIFRVDHFLAMPGTLNFQAVRDTNRLVRSAWSNEDAESIRLVFNEQVALEGRAEFYESTGAAKDMLQSHLLQTLARILSDERAALDSVDAPKGGAPIDILQAISPLEVRRGRYTAGEVNGEPVPAYADEEGVDPEGNTETWFRVVVDVDTERWAGVPVTLESGKAFGEDIGKIVVTFKPNGQFPRNVLELSFEEDDIQITMNTANPLREECREVQLRTDLMPAKMSAYGRVVKGIVEGIDYLAVSAECAVAGWETMERIGAELARVPMEEYPAGVHEIE